MEIGSLLPWREMLSACTLLSGVFLAIFLFISKYPSSRHLGILLFGYFVLLMAPFLALTINVQWLVIGLVVLVFQVYSGSFFTQNTRIQKRLLYPLGLWSLLVMVEFFLPEQDYLKWAATGLLLYQLKTASDLVFEQSNKRGIQWFSNSGSRLNWFKYFWILNALFLLMIVLGLSVITYDYFVAGVLVLIGIIYAQLILESSFTTPLPLGIKYKKSTLSPDIKFSILKKLDVLMANKFFLADDATLSKMADSLDTTTHHLSQVLNESKGTSFQELISQHRIREACQMMRADQNKQIKVESIATQVGYNSKSAFNAAFKKFTGVTPSQYRDNKNVQTYREVHLPDRKKPSIGKLQLSLNSIQSFKLKHSMLINFIKFFTRNLKRNKRFTFINLLGLSIGFASSILIYLYIEEERSFDQDIPRSEDIYRIVLEDDNPQTRTPHPMAQAMVREWPEVEAAVSISPWYGPGLSKQSVNVINEETNVNFDVADCFFADSTFFDVFDLKLVAGDLNSLRKPMTIVITQEVATRFFGDTNPIGKRLSMADMPLEVAAVVDGMPKNTHFHFSILLSYVTIKSFSPNNEWYTWSDFGHFNYIKVKPQTNVEILEGKIPEWVVGYLDWVASDKEILLEGEAKLALQPIQDIHLRSHLRWELEQNSNIQYVYILSASWVFILLIAAINYINLTTAKSVDRAKEIGIRKTMGAVSNQMAIQFCMESVVFCLMALALALLMAVSLLDSFNLLSGKNFVAIDIFNGEMMLKTGCMGLLIGLLSGYYPSLVLSGFKPSEVLKGKFSFSSTGRRFRGILVVFQFSVSALLITSSLIVMNQIQYMRNKPLGFDQMEVISFPISESVEYGGFNINQVKAIQTSISALSGVKQVAAMSNLPGQQFNQNDLFMTDRPEEKVSASEFFVDYDTDRVLDFEIVKGRSFDRSFSADSLGRSFLVNERTVAQLQLTDPIGQSISWDADGRMLEGKIVGVIKDFHYRSLHEPIQPLIMQISNDSYAHILVKMEAHNAKATLKKIESVYHSFESEAPFDPHYLDQDLFDLYQTEQNTLEIFSVFTVIAIFLSCLGLLGIALTLLSQRVKEIGVRKILGASALQIMQMIFQRFAVLILIALVIGLPMAYLLMQQWLALFAYQTTMSMASFIWAALLLLTVSLLSVGVVVVKVAMTNPIDSIRNE